MKNLALNVHGTNELNRVMLAEVNNLIPQLKNYEGQKFVNADGSRTKKSPIEFLKLQPNGLNGGHASTQVVYLDCTGYSVWLKVRICIGDGEGSCSYFDKTVYVAALDNGQILKDVRTVEEVVNDWRLADIYTEDGEAEKIRKYKELTAAAEQIKRSIGIKLNDWELR